jgi:branched-chain amino acid transport system permease protein
VDWSIFFQQCWNGLVNGVGYVQFALGLALIFGVLRVMNIAHGEFFMIGAMVVASLQQLFGMNFFTALIPSVILVSALGIICNRVAVRPLLNAPELSTLLSTLAISYILLNAGRVIWPHPMTVKTPFRNILKLGDIRITESSLMSVFLGGLIIAALYYFLAKTRMGKEIQATAQDRMGANLVGINVKGIYDITFIISAALAAVGGISIAPVWQPQTMMGQYVLLKGFAILVVGGLGNVTGCLMIGLAAGVVEALFGNYVSLYYKEGFLFVIMIIALLFKPGGLFGKE